MRLSQELETELRSRLTTVEVEHSSSQAFRDLPALDRWVIGLMFLAATVAVFAIR